jgi:sugar lactone lactonase YvrE
MNSPYKSLFPILFMLIFSVVGPLSISAQNWRLFKKNDSIDCRSFATDPLFNLYIMTSKNEVLKYDPQGFFESRYSNKKFGRIGLIDGTNAFKVVFWFPDFQAVQLMDALVNPIITLNLNDLGIARAAAVAMSDDGFLWVFDGGTNQLLKFSADQNGVKQLEKAPMSVSGLQPSGMTVRQNQIYMNVPNQGILVFDRFGKKIKTLDIKNATDFQVIDNQLFYKQNNTLFRFHLQTLATTTMKLPEGVKGEQTMRLERGRLFVKRGGSIDVFEEK